MCSSHVPPSIQSVLDLYTINAIQAESGGVPIIDVEGYVDGVLIGGIELQFEAEIVYHTLLPLIHKR